MFCLCRARKTPQCTLYHKARFLFRKRTVPYGVKPKTLYPHNGQSNSCWQSNNVVGGTFSLEFCFVIPVIFFASSFHDPFKSLDSITI